MKDHKVVEHVDWLIEEAPRLSWESIKQRFEGINHDITHGMLSAECKVKPEHFKYKWSVELDQAGYRVCYWQTRYLDVKNNSSSHSAIDQLFKRAGLKVEDDNVLWESDKVLEKL